MNDQKTVLDVIIGTLINIKTFYFLINLFCYGCLKMKFTKLELGKDQKRISVVVQKCNVNCIIIYNNYYFYNTRFSVMLTAKIKF